MCEEPLEIDEMIIIKIRIFINLKLYILLTSILKIQNVPLFDIKYGNRFIFVEDTLNLSQHINYSYAHVRNLQTWRALSMQIRIDCFY